MSRRGRAVLVPLLFCTARHHRSIGRLGKDDLRFRTLLSKHTANAFESAAGTKASYEIIETLSREISDNLTRRSPRVYCGIRFVLELAREKPSMRFSELDCFRHHAGST